MDDLSVQVFNAATSFMLAAALQAAGVPGPFLAIWVGSFTSVLPFSPNVKDVFDIVPLILFNSTYTTVGTPTIPLAAVNSINFTALSVPAPTVNLDTFIVRRFLDKPALEAALLRKQQSQLSNLVADKARAAWGVVEKDSVFSTPSIASITTTLKTLPIGAAELILLAITVIVIASTVVYVRLSRRESGRASTDEPQDGLATRHSNAEVEIDCGAPPAVPTSTVDDERVLDDVASSHVERDDGLETSPQSDQPPQIADAVEDLQSASELTPQPIPEPASFDDDTSHSNQPDSSSPSRTASPTPVADESTGDDYDEVNLEDTFISSPTPQDLPSPLDAVNESVISDERVLSDDVQTAENVDDNLSNALSDQSLSDKDCDEVLESRPREVDQDADTEEFIVEDSSFPKADVDCADADDESEAEDMSDDALISWTTSLKGHMSPDWFKTKDEDEDTENAESDASDMDDITLAATSEDVKLELSTPEDPQVTTPAPMQPFPFADTDDLPFFDIESNPLVIEDIFESFSATPEDVEDAMPSPIQPSFPVPIDDGPLCDDEESSSSDVDDASESSSATSEDPKVTSPPATVPSPRMDDDVQLHPDVEVVNAKLAETLENLKAKSSTSPPAAVVPVGSPATPASHSLMHLLPNATHSEPDASSEDEQSLALQRVFDKLQASARAAALEGANKPEDQTNDEAPGGGNLEAEPMLEKVDEALVESTEDTEQVLAHEEQLAVDDASLDSAPSTKQEDRPASPAPVDETPSVLEPAAEPEPVSPANEPIAPFVSSSPTPGQAQDERSTEDIIAAELKRHANNLDPENQRRIHGLPPPEVQKPATAATSTSPNSTAALSNSASSTAVPIGLPVTTIYSTATSIGLPVPGMAPTTTPMAVTAPTMVPSTTPTQSISVCETSPRRPRVNYPPRLDQQAPLVPPGLSRNVGPCGPVTSRVHPGPQAFRGPQQARAFNQRPLAFNAAHQGSNVPSHGLRAMNPTAPPFAPGPPRGMREFAPHQVPPPPGLQGPLPFNGMHCPPQQMPPQMMHELPPPPGIPMPPPPGLPMPRPPQANLNGMPPQQQLLGPPQQRFSHPGQHFSPMYQMPCPLGMQGPGPQQLSAGPPRFANLAPQSQAFQGPSSAFQGPPPPMPFPPGLGPMHQGPSPMHQGPSPMHQGQSPMHQGPSPMHQARPPMLLGPDSHPPMPAFDGPPPAMFDGPRPTMSNGPSPAMFDDPSPTVSVLPGLSPIVSPFRPSLRGEEYMRPAGLFAAPRAPGLAEAPEVPPGLPAPVAPVADVPALVEDVSAPVENAPASVDDTTAPLHDTLFLTEDARFKSLEADRASGAASAAPRPAHPRVQSPACEVDAPERPASAPPVTPETVDVTPETVDTTPEMITHVLRWREGGEVRRAVLQSPEDWVRSPKRADEIAAYGEQACDAGLQVEVENVQHVEHDAPASEDTTSAQVPTPSSENTLQESAASAPQRHKPRHRETIFFLGWGLPARATHR